MDFCSLVGGHGIAYNFSLTKGWAFWKTLQVVLFFQSAHPPFKKNSHDTQQVFVKSHEKNLLKIRISPRSLHTIKPMAEGFTLPLNNQLKRVLKIIKNYWQSPGKCMPMKELPMVLFWKRTTKVAYSIGHCDKTLSPQTSFRTRAPTSLKPLCNAMYKRYQLI
jgi:hypothetical protein